MGIGDPAGLDTIEGAHPDTVIVTTGTIIVAGAGAPAGVVAGVVAGTPAGFGVFATGATPQQRVGVLPLEGLRAHERSRRPSAGEHPASHDAAKYRIPHGSGTQLHHITRRGQVLVVTHAMRAHERGATVGAAYIGGHTVHLTDEATHGAVGLPTGTVELAMGKRGGAGSGGIRWWWRRRRRGERKEG